MISSISFVGGIFGPLCGLTLQPLTAPAAYSVAVSCMQHFWETKLDSSPLYCAVSSLGKGGRVLARLAFGM